MLNFLPKQSRIRANEEYLLRFSVVLMSFVFLAALLAILLFIPTAIFSKYDNRTITDQLASAEAQNAGNGTDTAALIGKLNGFADVLSRGESAAPPSGIADLVVSLAGKNIRIESISISAASGGAESVSVGGAAKTRDDLIAFEKNLQTNGAFADVDLPVSDLIKDANADFTIALTYKPQ